MGMYILRQILIHNLLSYFKSQYRTVVSVASRPKFNKRKYAIAKFQEILGIQRYKASEMVVKNSKLWEVNGATMKENYEICQKYEVSKEMCIKFPEILIQDNLVDRFEMLKKLPHDIHATAPLATLRMKKLEIFTRKEEQRRNLNLRIVTIKRILGTTTEQVYETFVSQGFLRYIDLIRMEENAKILTENGVTCDEILNDLWVLTYNLDRIKQRIYIAKDNNIDKIKTWMIRSNKEIFENFVKRHSENQVILGNCSAEYLSEKLDCSVDEGKGLLVKMPSLLKKSMKDMDEIINFLYSQGFKPYHILILPKILLLSLQTTSKRIEELEKQGMTFDSLHVLTMTEGQYLRFYKALVLSNQQKLVGTR